MNINTILEPLHEIEVLGAVGNNLPDFCPDIHPQTEADVKTAVNIDISAANRLIGEVVQSRRRPLLGPSPG